MSIAIEDAAFDRRREHILEEQDLRRLDAYWRTANYLTVGQIYSYGQAHCSDCLLINFTRYLLACRRSSSSASAMAHVIQSSLTC
jgi:hypothetical protein